MKESAFRQWVRASVSARDLWCEAYEPRLGGGTGIADLNLAVEGFLVPIELKVGEVRTGRLFCDEIRPDQIGWHNRICRAKIFTFFLAGTGSYSVRLPERIFAFQLTAALGWRKGIPLSDMAELRVGKGEFVGDLLNYVAQKADNGCYK